MMKHFLAKAVTGISLCIGMCALLLGTSGLSVYAANNSELDTSSTKAEVQETVDNGTFDYTKLSTSVIKHIYSLYGNDPETIRALQRQSSAARSSKSGASMASAYTHSSLFDGYKVLDGIDVSTWNGEINWKKVKASGVDFVFIRAGGRYTISGKYFTDSRFEENIKGATAAGLDVGVYFFSAAISKSEAKTEAAYVMKLISGYNINLPIVMDYEYDSGPSGRLYEAHLSKSAATNVVKAFCAAVEAKGYTGMIYASKSVLAGDMNAATIAKSYPVWSAQYYDTDTLTSAHSYWQYTSSGTIGGIEHATDLNFRYVKTPSAPKSLAQASSTDSSITLSWNKVPEVYGYQIYRYDSSKGKYVYVKAVKGASTLSYTDTGLSDGEQYKYKVRGFYKLKSGNVYGKFSDVASGITVSDTIENLNAKAASSGSIKLSWTAIPVVTGYRIYRYNSASGKYESIATLPSSDTHSYTDSGLRAGTQYSYKVKAYTKLDTGTIWHKASVAQKATTLPGPVKGLKSISSSTSIKLSWNKQKNVEGYIVYLWNNSTSSWDRLAKLTSPDKTTYKHTGLKSSRKYVYSVRAYYKRSGTYKYASRSDSLNAYTGPAATTSIWVKSCTTTSVSLAWKSVKNASGYLIYLYDSNAKSYKYVGKVEGNSTHTYTVSDLSATTTYKFAVKAYLKKDGVTGLGTKKVFSACTKPVTMKTSFKYKKLGSRTYLTWRKISGATGYIIYKYDKVHNKYTRVKKLTGYNQNTYVGANLSSSYSYRIRVYKTYNGKTYYGAISGVPAKTTAKIYGVVNDSAVYVRKGAGTNYSIIATLHLGRKVRIVECKKNKNGAYWYKVVFTKNSKKVTGYMHSSYIKLK